ncbi:PLP-dependent aminotransferase family protein [Rhizobium leguminosarum]|uniref:Aminotransferase class I/II-fold pyridoxal phosphate-dependent enzyme n=3 Tax=Rhizobium leguminosarum TaxID=384 RepID=A0A7K3VQW4_RHILE|nr:PLP-dependent aminotransferase family protein [Rhizobium leguminosarum]MBY2919354.1 PLP-dependent aminotransferase family protein [Rhizobium leguminosarum]MBY2975003.1 PLP-dependent aminotransferase family protein [Rhizobium leguminosarum]MBY2982543.1 PLP-dependent aminotransferase family protein [Rhizobium leguminosarum]MBY3010952.1 PLP-dependent aminotransferase family protein [Rhizobium leguminosarum]NEK19533.1 aminotransferase class I/II-fold pyridoxal phosphate-dependent enzyme [Rhizob
MVQLVKGSRKSGATRRIYLSLRDQILSGVYDTGEKLPSSRALADELGVSRTTVTAAYDQLISEGYIQVRQGAKPTVASEGRHPHTRAEPRPQETTPRVSAYASRAMALPKNISAEQAALQYDFRYGDVASSDFPKLAWRRALNAAVLAHRERLGYEHPAGSLALRRALQGYLWRSRGIECDVSQIIIVNGSQQALDLCARVLVDAGGRVVLEEPCYAMARNVMLATGAMPFAIPCDKDGMDTSRLPDPKGVALAFVTPSHQFPLGGVLPSGRRKALIEWAIAGNTYIIEDDYDGEYRYDVRPIPPLWMSGQGRVIYVGTVSKTLSPTLRLGYTVLPGALVEAFVRCKQITDRHSSSFEQEALASMIDTGTYESHVRKIRRLNAERRVVFLSAMAEAFGDEVDIVGTSAGLHIVAWFNCLTASDEERFADRARQEGVGIYPISRLFAAPTDQRAGFIFGYASMPVSLIGKAVDKLVQVYQSKFWSA